MAQVQQMDDCRLSADPEPSPLSTIEVNVDSYAVDTRNSDVDVARRTTQLLCSLSSTIMHVDNLRLQIRTHSTSSIEITTHDSISLRPRCQMAAAVSA